MKRYYLWLLLITLAWPLVQLLLFWARFGRLSGPAVLQSAYFLPVGLLSALALFYFLERATNHTTRVSTVVGYLVACPFAFLGLLASGLAFHPLVGTTVYGLIPLMLGTAVGYFMGRRVTE